MAPVWIIKTAALVIIFFIALLFGLVPFKLVGLLSNRQDYNWTQNVITLLNCFAGGIFLGTTFLDLLPEVREGFSDMWKYKNWGELEFPLAEFVVIIGFFSVVSLEHGILTLQSCCKKGKRSEKKEAISEDLNNKFSKTSGYGSITDIEPASLLPEKEQCIQSEGTKDSAPRSDSECSQCNDLKISIEHLDTNDALEQQNKETKHIEGVGSLLLLLALSLHTVFEGLALGLLQNSAEIWQLTFAIAIHKSVIVFSLGLRIAEEISNLRKGVLFIVGFSLMCPLGAVIGTIVSETSANSFFTQVVSTVLQGIATGTFLQVTFFEILHKEIGQGYNLIKVLATFSGFILMTVLIWYLHK